jgi:hypothetical protein
MEDVDWETRWAPPFTRTFDVRFPEAAAAEETGGGGRGAGRWGTSSEMGRPEEGIAVMIGREPPTLPPPALSAAEREEGYGEEGDRFTGEPEGDWGGTPIGGVGAGRVGCIELCLEGESGVAGIVSEALENWWGLFRRRNYFLRLRL